jgi:hypothetical protein
VEGGKEMDRVEYEHLMQLVRLAQMHNTSVAREVRLRIIYGYRGEQGMLHPYAVY